MILPRFDYHRPADVAQALAIAGQCGADFDFVAGGTDLLPNYKQRLNPRGHLISLSRVAELQGIGERGANGDGVSKPLKQAAAEGVADGGGRSEGRRGARLGAAVTLADLARSRFVRERFPVLAGACSEVASPLIQYAATLGGNLLVETRCFFFNQFPGWRQSLGYCLKAEGDECWVVPQKSVCYATYCGDLAPVLQVLGATLVLDSPLGSREVAASAFYRPDGIAKNVKARDEIIREVRLPEDASGLRAAYRKLRIRDTLDFPSMGAAAAMRLTDGRIGALRIAITAIDMVPLLLDDVTAPFVGEELSDAAIAKIASDVEARCRPLRNVPLTPPYRKKMVGSYVRDLLTRLRAAG